MYLIFIRLLFATAFGGPVNAVITSCLSKLAFRNKVITSTSLWEQCGVADKLACAVACMKDPPCLTFSYFSSEGNCRGYYGHGDYSKNIKNVDGQNVYKTCRYEGEGSDGRSCSRDDECIIQDSVCFEGNCLCRLGLKFSPDRNACLRECTAYGDQMDFYKGAGINGHNMKEIKKVSSMANCVKLCVDASCQTADWMEAKGYCWVSEYGYLEVEEKYRVQNEYGWGLLQRRCK